MSKHRVAVLKVVSAQLSVTAAAAEYEISRGHLHRLLRRYRDGGLEAVDPRSRRPRSNPGRTTDQGRERIVALRTELAGRGLDAGPVTIAWHLGRERLAVPSSSTIRNRLQGVARMASSSPTSSRAQKWSKHRLSISSTVGRSPFRPRLVP